LAHYDAGFAGEQPMAGTESDAGTIGGEDQALFVSAWQTYRKVVDHNYMFHREVYGLLHRILLEDAPRPFNFLDVACGDASATAGALRDTAIRRYDGIDISAAALAIARQEIGALGCPFELTEGNFVEVLGKWNDTVDVVWIGQSLHHLLQPAKVALMRKIRTRLTPGGLFLIWEPTTLDGEDRTGWVRRFESDSRALWPSLSDAEWRAMVSHVEAADYPETPETWLALGREAGFARASEIFVAPTRLARVYRFEG
jgi:SAM-dependent methyltransferase